MFAHDDLDEPIRLGRGQRVKPGYSITFWHNPKQIACPEPPEPAPCQREPDADLRQAKALDDRRSLHAFAIILARQQTQRCAVRWQRLVRDVQR